MMFLRRIQATAIYLFLLSTVAGAQDKPIGYWESHLSYSSALGVSTDGRNLFTISKQAFFTYRPHTTEEPITYSKIEGMSDIGMQCVAYDMATSTAVLVYANGNIDLFKDNTFYNIPDLKLKTISGNKQVYQVYTDNGTAYLSSSIGVIVIDNTDALFKLHKFN